MTWSLQASGHTPSPFGTETDPEVTGPQPWADVEQKLFDELKAVLAKPEYGTSAAKFVGNYVAGEPYDTPAMDATVIPALDEHELSLLEDLQRRQAAHDQYLAQGGAQ